MKCNAHAIRRTTNNGSLVLDSMRALRKLPLRLLKAICVGLTVIVLSQFSLPGQDHHITSVQVINGATHPELIPDSTAYRLFFLTVGQSSASDSNHQHALLQAAGLGEEDIQAAIPVIAKFTIAYQSMISTYNQTMVATNTATAEANTAALKALLKERDASVQAAKASLTSTISSQGMGNFDVYIQGEKRSMTAVEDVQQ